MHSLLQLSAEDFLNPNCSYKIRYTLSPTRSQRIRPSERIIYLLENCAYNKIGERLSEGL